MPDYQALKAAIAEPQFNGQTDDQIAATLNLAVATPVDTPIGEVLDILLANGDWPKVVQQSKGSGTDIVTLVAVQAVELVNQQGRVSDPIRTTQITTVMPAWSGALQVLEQATLISAATLTAILALATQQISPATAMGFAEVTVCEIAAARLV